MNSQTALHTGTSEQSKISISSAVILSEIKYFVSWWYIEMPAWYLRIIQRIIVICDDTLSMSLLIKTFFVPWHRDYSPVGRGFGIAMRMIYLPIAAFLSILLILGMFAVTIVWAFLPFIALFSILRSPFV